ncbi:MAG: chemotaxis protein CheW [Burkholderiales bacterium]|nr:chemotaxis protein CheW [Burkholderiales bacterium]
MSNREALRELQGRLARRLQQARTETRVQSWLAVECAGLGLLLPLPSAGEIFPYSPLLPVPHTRAWFLGVANLRGGLHGVVDLAAFLGLRAPLAADAVREGAQLLAFNPAQGAHCAVLVDRLAGLRSQGQLAALPDTEADTDAAAGPAGAMRPAFAGAHWRDESGRAWQEIDLAALARNEHFLAIAA